MALATLITLTDIQLAYGHHPLLDHADFAIQAGERIGLIGRNGAGKSSLLRLLDGRTLPDDGDIARSSGLRVATVEQEPELDENATVFDVVCNVEGDHEDWQRPSRVRAMLEKLGLPADVQIAGLSGGTRKRVALLLLGVYFAAPILMGNGRTGYVGLFIGLFVLYLLRWRITLLRCVTVAAAMSLLFAGVYLVSPNFKMRMDLLASEVTTKDATTPNGLRMSFMKVGSQAVIDRPLFGHGTGSFSEVFAPEARRIWAGRPNELAVRHQPHSEPLLLAVQFGLVGAGLYFALLGAIGKAALRRRDPVADALALLVAIYGVTSMFNSLLWNPTEAYWFLLLAGALYGHCIQRRGTAQ